MARKTSVRPLPLLLCAALAASACKEDAPPPRACCEQIAIPPDVAKFSVVADDAEGPSFGQKVKLRVGLAAPAKRDAIWPVLHTLYRHAMKRTSFEPIEFQAEVYASDSDARAAVDTKMLAKVFRTQADLAPKCDNRVTFDFAEQVANAFAASRSRPVEEDLNDTCHLKLEKPPARVDDGFKHKPTFAFNAAKSAVSITYPYLEMGKDEYVKELKLTTALTDWIEFATSMFHKVGDLKAVTFNGVFNDEPVLTITLSRAEFESSFTSLQEDIASHAAITFQALGMHKTTDVKAAKAQDAFKIKVYKAALAKLPKDRAHVSPKLKQ